jgi:hypothetical protein
MRRCADFNDDCAAGRIAPSPMGSCALVPIVAASAFASRTFEGVPPDPVQCVHAAIAFLQHVLTSAAQVFWQVDDGE